MADSIPVFNGSKTPDPERDQSVYFQWHNLLALFPSWKIADTMLEMAYVVQVMYESQLSAVVLMGVLESNNTEM
jgi:hypothetical protein